MFDLMMNTFALIVGFCLMIIILAGTAYVVLSFVEWAIGRIDLIKRRRR